MPLGSGGIYLREIGRMLRRLRHAPGFTIVATLTLAVAVLPSAIFRLVDRAVLPPLPYERSHELVALSQRCDFGACATSFPKLALLRERSRTLEVAAVTGVELFLRTEVVKTRINAIAVTPTFFSVLGAEPLLGRTFREDEDRVPLARPVVVLSEDFWRRQFDARPEVIGEEIVLNDVSFTVVGVTRESFRGWWGVVRRWVGFRSEDAWIPAMMAPVGMLSPAWRTARLLEAPHNRSWGGVARIRSGYELRHVRAELDLIGAEVRRIWPEDVAHRSVPFEAVPLAEDAVDPTIVRAVSLLTVAGGLVALLGALNVGCLFLVRGAARARTIGLERILGAPRSALVLGVLSEAVLIGIGGGLAALALTRAGLAGLERIEPLALRAPFGASLDPSAWHVGGAGAGAALGLGVGAAVLGSLVAAWRTTGVQGTALLRGGSGISAPGLRALRPTRPRGLLIVLQVTFALALTFPALLLLRSVGRLVTADLGFVANGVSFTTLALPVGEYEPQPAAGFVDDALDRLRRQGGLHRVGWVSDLPLASSFTTRLEHRGSAPRAQTATIHVASPDALPALGIPLRRGRDFGPQDTPDGPPTVILSDLAAQGLELGARVDVDAFGVHGAEVVGVVGDVPYRDPVQVPLPAVYLPLAQSPRSEGVLVVRSNWTSSDVGASVRAVIASLDRGLDRTVTVPLRQHVDQKLARFRTAAWLLSAAAALALWLAGVGVYGVLSSLVAGSTAELAIRVALGSTPLAVGRLVLGTTFRLAALGLAIGVSLALAGTGPLESYLYGVSRGDVWGLLLATCVSAGLALLAAWGPARRAMRADLVAALRRE